MSYSQKTVKCSMPPSLVAWVLLELKIVSCAKDQEIWLLCVTQLPHPPALLATYLEAMVNVAVVFNGRTGLLDEYYVSVSKCVQEFDATYMIEWDGVCKGLLRGEVGMFQTFVVGSGAQDVDESKDSNDDVEDCSATKLHPEKTPNLLKFPAKKAKGPQSDRKSGGKELGALHSRVKQANPLPVRVRMNDMSTVWYVFAGVQCCDCCFEGKARYCELQTLFMPVSNVTVRCSALECELVFFWCPLEGPCACRQCVLICVHLTVLFDAPFHFGLVFDTTWTG